MLAKVDGSVKQTLIRRGCPEIQLVPLRPAEEAAVVVFGEIGRKRAPSPVGTMMNRTISVDLMSASVGRGESQEFEDLLHGHHQSHSVKIDARHRNRSGKHEKRQPVLFWESEQKQRCPWLTSYALRSYDGIAQESTHEFCGGTSAIPLVLDTALPFTLATSSKTARLSLNSCYAILLECQPGTPSAAY